MDCCEASMCKTYRVFDTRLDPNRRWGDEDNVVDAQFLQGTHSGLQVG